jgi:outer membrane protein, adhesin transport system
MAAMPSRAQTQPTQDPNAVLADVVRRALSSSPDVSARVNALRGAGDAVDVVRGGLRPRVDVDAVVGRTNDRLTSRLPESQSLNHTGVALSATQLLWDGGAIRRDAARLGEERMTRWFEFLDASEIIALEAVRAFNDVLRFRRLVALAEDNYVQHKVVQQQMQSRVNAGVGRGVDLDQANARLALAESNLTTETANLHDVSARYQRVVGELPPPMIATPSGFDAAMPASQQVATETATRLNAGVSATIASMRAARESIANREAAFQPRVEARVRAGTGRNFDGIPDQKRDTSAQLALSWNLYSGGSDQARVRQATRLMNQAEDQRDKVCRDVRQTAAIAYNESRKLYDSITALEKNATSIIRARDAYRQQFDIGQRSLLDVLNAENEVYTARRAVTNARIDLAVAQARTLAAMQGLTSQLGVARPTEAGEAPEHFEVGTDGPKRCPISAASSEGVTPRSELDARAGQVVRTLPSVPAPAATNPATPAPGSASPSR